MAFVVCLKYVNKSEINIQISKVAEVSDGCRLFRWELLRLGRHHADIDVRVHASLREDRAEEKILLRLEASYSYMRSMVRRPLLLHTVEVEFEIPEMAQVSVPVTNGEKISLPPSLMNMMIGVGVGALRGMIAQRTAGTPLEDRPLPLINISSLVSRLIYGEPSGSRVVPLEEPICR